MKEANVQRVIQLAAGERGYITFRNNVGQAWQGKPERQPDGTLLLRDPRPVQFGLCKGSGDLIGFKRVTVTPDMVGQTIAQFASVEVKSKDGRPTAKQSRFVEFVRDSGGLACIARGPEDLP